jgi:hypothetical protein
MISLARRSFLGLVWAASFSGLGFAAEPPSTVTPSKPAKTVRLVTVGNSFSANATKYLKAVVQAAGNELVHAPIVVGGASLELHWGRAELHEKDPQNPKGVYTDGRGLKEVLQSDRWDYVTIQQASFRSHDVQQFRPFARSLHDYIQRYAPTAEVLIHHTWPYRRDDPWFTGGQTKPGEPTSQAAMYRAGRESYLTIARELGVRRIPTGDAFYAADTDPAWGYQVDEKFDLIKAKYPLLPDQTHSLHVGWQWKASKDGKLRLTMDGHHANTAGEYLGACCFYEMLYDESVVGNSFVPPGVAPEDVRYLQETAHKAVAAAREVPAAAQ